MKYFTFFIFSIIFLNSETKAQHYQAERHLKNNFQIFDVVDFKYRPLDNNLFQVDMFFINKKSNIINDKRYSL